MVSGLKNTYAHKRILPNIAVSILVFAILSVFWVQLSHVSAQSPAANLTGTIYDSGVDTDDDGTFDFLKIGVEVNVSNAETLQLEISGLYDSEYNYISVSKENSTYLEAGIQVIYISLEGTSIYVSGFNPSIISGIFLYDENENSIDELHDVSLSKEYSYTEFDPPPARFTGTISDKGVDADEDGLFDYLEVGIELTIATPGTFRVDASGLYDSEYNYISVSKENSTYLEAGIQVVYISLDGTRIYASEINPSTVSSIFLYDEYDEKIDDLYDVSLSREYFYMEFERPPIRIEFNEIRREIVLDQWGSIYITNAYYITNIGNKTSDVEIGFPDGAYDFAARDEMGSIENSAENETVMVNLRAVLYTTEPEKFYLSYRIPWQKYITQQNGLNYNFDFTFFERFNGTIGKLTVSIILPKGAEFQSSTPLDPQNIEKGAFQETVTFAFSNVTQLEDLKFNIKYAYLVFWASFYPTLWMGILIIIASVIAFLWRAPKATMLPMVSVPPEDLRSFVEKYEEKTRILAERESMEEKLRKGRIRRRRYKVRKRMLEGRLSTLSRDLSNLGEKIRGVGSKYANIMRQIEVAETIFDGVEKDIRRVEARYRRGEISKGAYGKLVEEYHNRMEKARTTIDGVLLRLKEEIR